MATCPSFGGGISTCTGELGEGVGESSLIREGVGDSGRGVGENGRDVGESGGGLGELGGGVADPVEVCGCLLSTFCEVQQFSWKREKNLY